MNCFLLCGFGRGGFCYSDEKSPSKNLYKTLLRTLLRWESSRSGMFLGVHTPVPIPSIANRAAIYRSLQAHIRKKVSKKGLLGCLQKSPAKTRKCLKHTQKRWVFLDFFGDFRDFSADHQKDTFWDFLAILGLECSEDSCKWGVVSQPIYLKLEPRKTSPTLALLLSEGFCWETDFYTPPVPEGAVFIHRWGWTAKGQQLTMRILLYPKLLPN